MSAQDTSTLTVSLTGHRPPKIGGYNPNSPTRAWLRVVLRELVQKLQTKHSRIIFRTGMALGSDMDWALAVLEQGGHLEAYCPGDWQADRWNSQDKLLWAKIREEIGARGGIVYDLYPSPKDARETVRRLMQRNHLMVDGSTFLVAVWDGSMDGGTARTVAYAKKVGVPWMWINPKTRDVRTFQS